MIQYSWLHKQSSKNPSSDETEDGLSARPLGALPDRGRFQIGALPDRMMIARDGGYRCNYSGLDGYARTARLRRVSSLKTLIPTAVSAKLKRFWEWPLSSTAEQRTHNPLVGGSNPPGATKFNNLQTVALHPRRLLTKTRPIFQASSQRPARRIPSSVA
jgi:hypothetical protein